MFGPYSRVLRTPGFRLPFFCCMASAFPLGMAGLALLFTAQARSGSMAQAGLVPAAFGLGNAAGLLVQGRLIDRHGQTRVLVPASLLCTFALLAAISAPWRASFALPALVFLAGAAFPATIGSMRVLTSTLVPDPLLRSTAYALLSVSFVLAMMVGPLLVSALLTVTSPTAAVAVAASLAGAGGLGFAAAPASRRWLPTPGASGLRIARSPGLVTVLAANTVLGLAGGITAVAIPAAALAQGVPALAGIGFALLSAGDLAGGLAYGAIGWNAGKAIQLLTALTAASLIAWMITMAAGSLPVLYGMLLLAGAAGACVPICTSSLLDDVAPAGTLTTSYTLMVGLSLVAQAAGNAAAGVTAEHLGTHATFALAAAALTTAACCVALRRSTLLTRAGSRSASRVGNDSPG